MDPGSEDLQEFPVGAQKETRSPPVKNRSKKRKRRDEESVPSTTLQVSPKVTRVTRKTTKSGAAILFDIHPSRTTSPVPAPAHCESTAAEGLEDPQTTPKAQTPRFALFGMKDDFLRPRLRLLNSASYSFCTVKDKLADSEWGRIQHRAQDDESNFETLLMRDMQSLVPNEFERPEALGASLYCAELELKHHQLRDHGGDRNLSGHPWGRECPRTRVAVIPFPLLSSAMMSMGSNVSSSALYNFRSYVNSDFRRTCDTFVCPIALMAVDELDTLEAIQDTANKRRKEPVKRCHHVLLIADTKTKIITVFDPLVGEGFGLLGPDDDNELTMYIKGYQSQLELALGQMGEWMRMTDGTFPTTGSPFLRFKYEGLLKNIAMEKRELWDCGPLVFLAYETMTTRYDAVLSFAQHKHSHGRFDLIRKRQFDLLTRFKTCGTSDLEKCYWDLYKIRREACFQFDLLRNLTAQAHDAVLDNNINTSSTEEYEEQLRSVTEAQFSAYCAVDAFSRAFQTEINRVTTTADMKPSYPFTRDPLFCSNSKFLRMPWYPPRGTPPPFLVTCTSIDGTACTITSCPQQFCDLSQSMAEYGPGNPFPASSTSTSHPHLIPALSHLSIPGHYVDLDAKIQDFFTIYHETGVCQTAALVAGNEASEDAIRLVHTLHLQLRNAKLQADEVESRLGVLLDWQQIRQIKAASKQLPAIWNGASSGSSHAGRRQRMTLQHFKDDEERATGDSITDPAKAQSNQKEVPGFSGANLSGSNHENEDVAHPDQQYLNHEESLPCAIPIANDDDTESGDEIDVVGLDPNNESESLDCSSGGNALVDISAPPAPPSTMTALICRKLGPFLRLPPDPIFDITHMTFRDLVGLSNVLPDEVVGSVQAEGFDKIDITSHNISTLSDEEWLDGDVLDVIAIASQITDVSSKDKINFMYFPTQTTIKLFESDMVPVRLPGAILEGIARMLDMRRPGVFPINISRNHWCVAFVDSAEGTLKFYDPKCTGSDKIRDPEVLGKLRGLRAAIQFVSGASISQWNTNYWPMGEIYFVPSGLSVQKDGHNCGVFVCLAIETWSRKEGMEWTVISQLSEPLRSDNGEEKRRNASRQIRDRFYAEIIRGLQTCES